MCIIHVNEFPNSAYDLPKNRFTDMDVSKLHLNNFFFFFCSVNA